MPVTRQQSRRDGREESTHDRDEAKKEVKKAQPRKSVAKEVASGDGVEVQGYNVLANDKEIYCERRGGSDDTPALIFTHGAGGGLQTPAAKDFAEGFAAITSIVSFQGNMNIKSRIKAFHAVVENEKTASALGGRSMGARAAVMTAQEGTAKASALVLVSYPLEAGGKNDDERRQILMDLPKETEVLFIIGSKDSMCQLEKLNKVRQEMTAESWLVEVAGADHGMNLSPKAAGETVRKRSGELAATWLREKDNERPYCLVEWDQEANEVVVHGWKQDSDIQEPAKKKRRKAP